MSRASIAAFILVLLFPSSLLAEETAWPPENTEVDSPRGHDTVRGRGAITGSFGALVDPYGLTIPVAGLDGRVGVQITDLVAAYVQPTTLIVFLSVLPAATAVVDFTIADRFFIGAGGGAGVWLAERSVEAPRGLFESARSEFSARALGIGHFRVGGYPTLELGSDGARRQGLVLSLDLRVFVDDDLIAPSPTAAIGYEWF